MSDKLYQNNYRIPSARATWHDYNGGAYFITVCTKNRECYFGEITNVPVEMHRDMSLQATIQLSPIGQLLHENLQNATVHYPYAEIPLFVVMPNHWHAIVIIDGDKIPAKICRDVTCHVSTNPKMRNIRNQQGFLSTVIGGIKATVTKYANENNIEFAWQTRFYDRIVRHQNMMNTVADYIENNVVRWDRDCFNEKNVTANINAFYPTYL
ncbi:MAG: hypothetical protein LBC40_09820 [Dysgonamonadaceae bacterium]|jgi:REP element-mobilizing transposase RayT|nr:hypothetical protein [Dysgonamonadaceae bacterium]